MNISPALPPEVRESIARLRPPLSTDAFNEVVAGKQDFMAMLLRADGEGCQDILAQQMQDQTARDIVTVVNAVASVIAAQDIRKS